MKLGAEGPEFFKLKNHITLRISQSTAILSGSSMMNILMLAFASSPGDKIFSVKLRIHLQTYASNNPDEQSSHEQRERTNISRI